MFHSIVKVSQITILHFNNNNNNNCAINQFSVKGWKKDPLRSKGYYYYYTL